MSKWREHENSKLERNEHRYADCDQCGERYWDDDIESYMVEVYKPGSDYEEQRDDGWVYLCRGHGYIENRGQYDERSDHD